MKKTKKQECKHPRNKKFSCQYCQPDHREKIEFDPLDGMITLDQYHKLADLADNFFNPKPDHRKQVAAAWNTQTEDCAEGNHVFTAKCECGEVLNLEEFMASDREQQRQKLEGNGEIPMGISQWKTHGQRYGYDKYFKITWPEAKKPDMGKGQNQICTKCGEEYISYRDGYCQNCEIKEEMQPKPTLEEARELLENFNEDFKKRFFIKETTAKSEKKENYGNTCFMPLPTPELLGFQKSYIKKLLSASALVAAHEEREKEKVNKPPTGYCRCHVVCCGKTYKDKHKQHCEPTVCNSPPSTPTAGDGG